jgi:predicted transcriptional regulator
VVAEMVGNEIKALIAREGKDLKEVVDKMNRIHGEDVSLSSVSQKLRRKSIKYVDVEKILDALGYDIKFVKREGKER